MEVVFKFKREIFGFIFAGVMIFVGLYFLNPDKSAQIFDTLTFLAVIIIMIPLLAITLQYFVNKR